ncbi:hypothetical protein HDV00_006007 [Rhizophlyctis rosea]|nr:hypothetical protein HDV00_006007 [Rhizophlyctis rosea]
MPKLPSFLYGTYQRYKTDTGRLITWMIQTANALGSAESLPKATLTKHKFTTKQLLAFAEHIVAHAADGRISASGAVLCIMGRIISYRRECASYFASASSTGRRSEEFRRHEHFIKLVENIKQMLEPILQSTGTAARDSTVRGNRPTGENVETSNRFSILDAEELPDYEEDDDLSGLSSSTGKATTKPMVINEPELVEEHQVMLMVYGLIRDSNLVRKYLQSIWRDYKDHKLDLITASLTTTLAVDVIRQLQDQLVAVVPTFDNYQAIVLSIFLADRILSANPDREACKEVWKSTFWDVAIHIKELRDGVLSPGLTFVQAAAYNMDPQPYHSEDYTLSTEQFQDESLDISNLLQTSIPYFLFYAKDPTLHKVYQHKDDLAEELVAFQQTRFPHFLLIFLL